MYHVIDPVCHILEDYVQYPRVADVSASVYRTRPQCVNAGNAHVVSRLGAQLFELVLQVALALWSAEEVEYLQGLGQLA